jgi:hypothetical protein
MIIKRKPSKKRARYEEDDDFNVSDAKNGDIDFVPSRRRYVFFVTIQILVFFFINNFLQKYK